MKRLISAAMVLCVLLSCIAFAESNAADITELRPLSHWANGTSREAFVAYVDAVTDENSLDYIPPQDRLAVFDLDGTLCGEQFPIYFEWMMYAQRVLDDPDYIPTEEQIAVAEEVIMAARDGFIPAGLEERQFWRNAEVYAGMTCEAYRAYVARFLAQPADRFIGLTLADAWFRPIVQAAQYLQQHGFTVYVCSGTDRDADRVMIADVIGIPYRQVIGSDCYTVGTAQGNAGYLDYQYTPTDEPVRTGTPIIKNVKSSKPMQLMQELGQKPVIAFGNSTGDTSMFMYTTYQNPYPSIAFCVVPDDDAREVAYPDKTAKLTALCEENGWYPISMKNDFVTIYGDDVVLDLQHTPWLDDMLVRLEQLQCPDEDVLPDAA